MHFLKCYVVLKERKKDIITISFANFACLNRTYIIQPDNFISFQNSSISTVLMITFSNAKVHCMLSPYFIQIKN